MISLNKDSISHVNSSIPSLPKGLNGLKGAQLPDGNLVISGGFNLHSGVSDEHLLYKVGLDQWRKVGTMKEARCWHSSVWIDGRLLTTGGWNPYDAKNRLKITPHHEEFSFDGGVKERKEMPMSLDDHAATIFDRNKMIVTGGYLFETVT